MGSCRYRFLSVIICFRYHFLTIPAINHLACHDPGVKRRLLTTADKFFSQTVRQSRVKVDDCLREIIIRISARRDTQM